MNDAPTPPQREDQSPAVTKRVLSGRYELGELLGRGGMADVYRGIDTRLGRTVAVKLLRQDLARDPQFLARFKREAQSVAALNHPSIVSIFDTGEHPEDPQVPDSVRLPYIVMEYVPGQTLRDLIRAGEVSTDQAVEFTLGVLSALEYSHKAGIVHRDIKPANVMFCAADNSVKVMDFGIARAIADSAATMTQTQAVVGTAQYLSPEQALGETVDARSDLYSAGCLLYELLTGRPPFVGDSPVSVAYQHVRELAEPAATHNPEVSPALDSVLSKALQKKRTDRFPDAAAFQRALRAARNGIAVPAPAVGDASTDPHNHVPAADPGPPTEAFAFAGAAAFDDDGRSGSYREGTDDDAVTTVAPLAAAYDPVDREAMPLGLPLEQERSQPQKSRRRTWIATLVIFTLLILAGVGLWLYNVVNAPSAAVTAVSVPVVADMSEAEALQELYEADLSPTVNRTQHPTVAKGMAIGTEPGAGAVLERDTAVVLNVSDGPSSVAVPDGLVGKTEAAARDLLRQHQLSGADGTTQVHSATVPVGIVISTNPGAGQQVAVGTKVQLVVSTGKVAVPELRGRTKAEATAALEELRLVPAIVEVENGEVEPGRVTAQSEPANAEVEPGRTITVTIAKAPAPLPPPPPPAPVETPTPKDLPPNSNGNADPGPKKPE